MVTTSCNKDRRSLIYPVLDGVGKTSLVDTLVMQGSRETFSEVSRLSFHMTTTLEITSRLS